jgi:hypothetical protein
MQWLEYPTHRYIYFSQLLNAQKAIDVRQIEIHIAELLVLDPIHFEVEIAIVRFERCELPGCD